MKNRLLKIGLAGIVVILGGYFGLALYAMSKMSISHLIQCSVGEGGTRIPSELCEHYMRNYRAHTQDMKDIAVGGLDPILNLSNTKKYELAEFFLSKGLDINGANHYQYDHSHPVDITPLHASVLLNDVERARFLISHGANINIKSKHYNDMTPLEFAQELEKKKPSEERRELIRLLSN